MVQLAICAEIDAALEIRRHGDDFDWDDGTIGFSEPIQWCWFVRAMFNQSEWAQQLRAVYVSF